MMILFKVRDWLRNAVHPPQRDTKVSLNVLRCCLQLLNSSSHSPNPEPSTLNPFELTRSLPSLNPAKQLNLHLKLSSLGILPVNPTIFNTLRLLMILILTSR